MTKLEPIGRDLEVEPPRGEFARRYAAGQSQVVWTRLVADLETPVSAMLKLSDGQPLSCLLESVQGGATRGRYSIIGLAPDVIWRAFGNRAEINQNPAAAPHAFKADGAATLKSLRALLDRSRIELPSELPPIAAGIIGYMGYDTVRLVEHLPDQKPDALRLPDAVFVRPTLMVVFDTIKDEMMVVTPVRPAAGMAAEAAYAAALGRLRGVLALLDAPLPHATSMSGIDLALPDVCSNTTPAEYMAMVERGKEYIAAGDVFQVVLSQRFAAPFALPPLALYRALRRTNPSPFLFHLDFGEFALVGSSPEILVRVRDGEVTLRPLAGTRRRGATPEEDKALEKELLADPKERAEHLMLLDLGRNDVGRVAEIGSVHVKESFAIERFSHVMHISSNVEGNLRKDCGPLDALAAGFPAGTVSGAPKVRAMQIIDELEKEKRSLYAGCVGYFSAGAQMDTCIALRTALLKDGKMYVQAGAGIVADSDPDFEQQECINKAKALFRAAEEARRFASAARRGQ